MKKLLSVLGLGVLLTIFITPSAFSYTIANVGPNGGPYTYPNSGDYLGTVLNENDSIATVEGVLSQLGLSVDILGWSKVDDPPGDGLISEGFDFNLYATNAGDGSGQWATYFPVDADIPEGATELSFYVVKGGNDFALYELDPASAYGTWNIENLEANPQGIPPGISHFSGYTTTTRQVPEPATMLLLGFGLFGLAITGRKIKK